MKIDALKRQREAQPHRIILDPSPPRDVAHAAAQAEALADLDSAAARSRVYKGDNHVVDNHTPAGQLFGQDNPDNNLLPIMPSRRGVNVDRTNSLLEVKFRQFLANQRLKKTTLEEYFVTPKKLKINPAASSAGPIEEDDHGQGGMGIDAYQKQGAAPIGKGQHTPIR